MPRLINMDIMREPMNWVIVLSMIILGAVALDMIRQLLSNTPKEG